MQLRTLLFLAVVLHCTHRTGIFLHWYWNKSSDEITGSEEMVDGKIHKWNTENNSTFPENEKIKKKLEKACADLENLSIESHDDNNDVLAYMMRIQNQITHIHENIEWSTKRIVDRNVEAAARYQSSLEKLRKINETMHTIWNGIEFMLSDVEQKLGWINDDVNNRSEQLNRIYQTAQHIFYLLGAVVVAAFLQAPFITRALIIIIVPLNIMAFLKHGNMEDCLGFGSTTALICFMTAVHFLMGAENGISHERLSTTYRQFKIETFLTATKSQMYESLTATNVVIKKLFEVLIQMLNIKGSIIRNWQVAATWFRQHNLIYGTKTFNSGEKQLSIHDLSLKKDYSDDKNDYRTNQLMISKDDANHLNSVSVKISRNTYGSDSDDLITIEKKAKHINELETAKEPSNDMPKKLTKPSLTEQDSSLEPPFGESREKLTAGDPSAQEDKANDTNEIRTAQEKSNIMTIKSSDSRSPEPDASSDLPLEGARKNPITDINNIKTTDEKFDVMPKKSTESSSNDRVTCSNSVVKENSSAQERLACKDAKAHSNPVADDNTKPFTEVTEKPDPNATNSTQSGPHRPVGRIQPNSNQATGTIVQPNITRPNENANASNINPSPSRSPPATAPAYSQNVRHQQNDSTSSIDSNDHIQSHTEARRSEINERIGYNSCQSQLSDDRGWTFNVNWYTPISPKSCSSGSVAISPISDLCGAMTQKGTPCRNKPSYGGPWCWRHSGVTVSMPSPARSSSSGYDSVCSSSGTCGAMTQKGTPCRNKPSYGGSRCWRH